MLVKTSFIALFRYFDGDGMASESSNEEVNVGLRKTTIFQAATELFCKNGYSGTRMTDIANAVGVTKPIIYRYFSSKEELFGEWVDLILAQERHELASLLANFDCPLRETTKSILDRSLRGLGNQTMMAPWRIALVEAENFPNISKLICSRFKDPLLTAIEELFAQGITKNELKGDAFTLARLFTSPIASAAVIIATFGNNTFSGGDLEKLFTAHYQGFWAAWGN